jgi:Spy/CpxP family protein refolding chaperone
MTHDHVRTSRLFAVICAASLAAGIAFGGLEARLLTPVGSSSAASSYQAQANRPPGSGGKGQSELSAPGRAGGPWWRDEAIKSALGLSEGQIRRLDSLFERRAKELEPLNEELNKQRMELNRLMIDRNSGVAAIALQVARMEVPRAKINESFYVMMYRMSLVLDPAQDKKLQAVFAASRGRGRGGR